MEAINQAGLGVDNIAFGMGGELLQKVNRDTLKYAIKASAVAIDGTMYDVYKDSITDSGKRSKKGILAVIKDDEGNFQTIRQQDLGEHQNLLQIVFKGGELIKDIDFDEVRRNRLNAN